VVEIEVSVKKKGIRLSSPWETMFLSDSSSFVIDAGDAILAFAQSGPRSAVILLWRRISRL
jgi:hypothetical protein